MRHLHLGHLAKAFALREAPNAVTSKARSLTRQKPRKEGVPVPAKSVVNRRGLGSGSVEGAEQRMTAVVRMQGRLSKKGGLMVTSDASEFQIAGEDTLKSLVRR